MTRHDPKHLTKQLFFSCRVRSANFKYRGARSRSGNADTLPALQMQSRLAAFAHPLL